MNILLDSNILLRLSQPGHPHEGDTTAAVDLIQRRHNCVIVPQTIYEYWVVATRPVEANGLGFDPEFAAEERDQFLQLFQLLRDERAVYEHWRTLVDDHEVRGVRAHDVRYVAALKRHGIGCLLTYNERHFRGFSDITILTPPKLLAAHRADPGFVERLA
jgi:predicted nucleic acid-binding protein